MICSVLALAPPPASSAGPGSACLPDRVQVWRLRRVSTGARPLDVTLGYVALDSRSTLTVVAAAPNGRRSKVAGTPSSLEMGTYDGYAHAYGGDAAPVTTPSRPGTPMQACGVGRQSTLPLTAKANAYEWFIATVNFKTVTFTFDSPGWTVSKLPPASGANLRILRTYDGPGSGVELGVHQSAEHFTGVEADGGPYGSVAFASLPCDRLDPATPTPTRQATGWGAAALIGGDSTPSTTLDRHMKCDGHDVTALGAARGPTKWTVHGEAVGQTASLNRLTVFDFPKA